MKQLNYTEMPGLEHIYLEDSYVLDIETGNNFIFFFLELVLTEEHLNYQPPSPQEQYCYKKAYLKFCNVRQINWINKYMLPYSDASGDIDYGNIDILKLVDNNYYISGDWGEVEIISDLPKIEIID